MRAEAGGNAPIIALVGTHADVALQEVQEAGRTAAAVVAARPAETDLSYRTPPEESALLGAAAALDDSGSGSDDEGAFFDAVDGGDSHRRSSAAPAQREASHQASGPAPAGLPGGAAGGARRTVSLEEGEALAARIGARTHVELPALVPAERRQSGGGVGHPVTQVVYSLLSDLLLGEGWEPELMAARQRLAWAVAALPHQLPPRLPLTIVQAVANTVGRCASRPVLARERRAEAEQLHRQGQYERALEAYAQVQVVMGKDEAIEAYMRRAEAARWRQSHDEAQLGGMPILGGLSPPSSHLAAAVADGSKWWLWVDDSYSSDCFRCRAPFTFFRRRHHCRHCGHLFCSACSDKLAAGLWRVPPSPSVNELPDSLSGGATQAGSGANTGKPFWMLGFVGSQAEAEQERIEQGLREDNLERVCRGCWKVLRAAETRAAERRPNASHQQLQEAALRRRAAREAAAAFFSTAEDPAISSVALVQYLHAHADRRFLKSNKMDARRENHKAVAAKKPKAAWVDALGRFLAGLEAEAEAEAGATCTPRSVSVPPDA